MFCFEFFFCQNYFVGTLCICNFKKFDKKTNKFKNCFFFILFYTQKDIHRKFHIKIYGKNEETQILVISYLIIIDLTLQFGRPKVAEIRYNQTGCPSIKG